MHLSYFILFFQRLRRISAVFDFLIYYLEASALDFPSSVPVTAQLGAETDVCVIWMRVGRFINTEEEEKGGSERASVNIIRYVLPDGGCG